MREVVTSVAEVAGAVSIVVGSTQVAVPAGWLVGGGFCLLFAWRLSR